MREKKEQINKIMACTYHKLDRDTEVGINYQGVVTIKRIQKTRGKADEITIIIFSQKDLAKIVELAKPPWPPKHRPLPATVTQDIGGGMIAKIEADPNRLRVTLSMSEEKDQSQKEKQDGSG